MIGQKTGTQSPVWGHLAPHPRHTGAGRFGLAGVLIWYRAVFLTHWHIQTRRLCYFQQFFAGINCPQSESPNGYDIVLRFEDLRPHPRRGNPFRTPSSADLKNHLVNSPGGYLACFSWPVKGLLVSPRAEFILLTASLHGSFTIEKIVSFLSSLDIPGSNSHPDLERHICL